MVEEALVNGSIKIKKNKAITNGVIANTGLSHNVKGSGTNCLLHSL